MKSHLIYLPKAVPHFNIKSVQRREGEKRKMKMNEIENLSINTHQHSSGYHQNSRIIMIGTTTNNNKQQQTTTIMLRARAG